MNAKLLILAGCAASLLAAPIVAQSVTAPPGDPVKGKQAYLETGCYACHGTVGHGGAWQGPKLAPQPLAYPLFLRQVRSPVRSMPRYGQEVLSDSEVADIYAYLQKLPKGADPDKIAPLRR